MKMFKMLGPDDLPLWCYECGGTEYVKIEEHVNERETRMPHMQYACKDCGALYKYYKTPPSEHAGLRFHKK